MLGFILLRKRLFQRRQENESNRSSEMALSARLEQRVVLELSADQHWELDGNARSELEGNARVEMEG